ncbi:MAG TPA: hypothetical protein VGO40_19065 [Longimicrobium sp.]|jgi:hypothetical protein|nr:hypothetical protein [Longimicrobium sp.]
MSKLKLDIDALRVESFETAAALGSRGTVRGAQLARCTTDAYDCDPLTCGPSCIGSCTSNGAAAAQATPQDESFLQTCWFYTCGGCTTADPAYCPPAEQ